MEKENKELTVNDFKLGLRAARLYEQIHGEGKQIADDLLEGKNNWDIIAICKAPSTMESYKEFVVSDEYDNLINIAFDIMQKLWKDITPKKG